MSTKNKQYKFTCIYDENLDLNQTPRDRRVLEDTINKSAYDLLKTLNIVKSHDENKPVLNKLYSRIVNGEPCLIACDGRRLMIERLGLGPLRNLNSRQIPMDRFWEVNFYKDSIYFTDQTRAMNFLGYMQYLNFDGLMMDLYRTDFLIEISKYNPYRETIVSPSVRVTQFCASKFGVYFDSDQMPFDGLIDSYKDNMLVGVNKEKSNQLHVECKSFVFIMIAIQNGDYLKVMPDSKMAMGLFFRKPLPPSPLFPDWSLNDASSK